MTGSNARFARIGIALGSASQIALFVAPALVLVSYLIAPSPMGLRFWPGAVVMILMATMTALLVTNSGRSTWFRRRPSADGLFDFRHDALPPPTVSLRTLPR